MSKFIINDRQPFGEVVKQMEHPGTLANAKPHSNANLGADMKVGNNGRTVVESFADKNPNAYVEACKGRDNPFGPVGKSFGVGHTNLTERYTNAN